MQTLWGENVSRPRRRKRNVATLTSETAYCVTGGNDCEILGHSLNFYDLAGCTTCMDCHVKVFCPACTTHHPQDVSAVAILCEKHEGQVNHAI